MFFHDFFGIDFRIVFFIDFWWKMAPKIVHFILMRRAFWLPFRDLFRRSIFRCILVALWLTFGSLLAPFGSLWLPFAPLWLPFGSLWHPLGDLLAPIGSLLAPFGSLLLPLKVHFLTFAASSPHFGSSLYKFGRKPHKSILPVSFCIEFPFFQQPLSQRIEEIRRQTDRR